MTENKFCLHWTDYETNMTVAMKDLREEKDFFDLTIACEDAQIQAHKVILSACSPFFRNLLRCNPHQHPLLYLKGVKFKELLGILDFMYNGEVNVAQEELKQFLAVAADLKVKGLTQKMAIPTIPAIPSVPTIPTPVKPTPETITTKAKRQPEVKEPARKRQRPIVPTNVAKAMEQVDTYLQVEEEMADIVSTQQVVIESPNPRASQTQTPIKIIQDMTPRKIIQDITPRKIIQDMTPRKMIQVTTPAPEILEQCILEAEIHTEQEPMKTPKATVVKTNTVTPIKGPDMNQSVKKSEVEYVPVTGENWQCRVCKDFFPTKDRTMKHLHERHDISTHARMKKNMERFVCT